MNAMERYPRSNLTPVSVSGSGHETKRVRVIIRKRNSSRQIQPLQLSSHDKRIDVISSKLVNYTNRAVKSCQAAEIAKESHSKNHQSCSRHKQIRLDLSPKIGFSSSYELDNEIITDLFYTAKEIERMTRYHHKLATRVSSSNQDDDLRGLEDLIGVNGQITSNQRKVSYLHAVLDEQARQRNEGYLAPDELRKKARMASKSSRTIALQLGQKDAMQQTMQYDTVSPAARPRFHRSKSICGPKNGLASIVAAATVTPSDRRSLRRSKSMRLNARTATVVM
jgi:hypothetical protein